MFRNRFPAPSRWLFLSLVGAATAFAFRAGLSAGFIAWDDLENFVRNENYRGFGATNLKWMFTAFHMGVYTPLTWLTCAFDYELWGMNAAGYHLTNLVLHALNAVLVFRIAASLYDGGFIAKRTWSTEISAACAALFFSVHPLRVESVVWATERRDVLSVLFFLLSIFLYLRERKAASLGAFACSLLSKATGVTLPALLIILDFYRAPRMDGRAWMAALRGKIPYALLSLPFAAAALFGQAEVRAAKSLSVLGPTARIAVASRSVVFYLWKTVWPFHLSPLYRLPPPESLTLWPFPAYFALAALTTILLALRARKERALAAAWFWYILALLPLSGVFQSGNQLAADRYSYIPCMSWAVLVGGIFRNALRTPDSRIRVAASAALLALIGGFGFLTDRQTRVWRDSDAFWAYVLSEDPGSAVAHNNKGAALAERGDLNSAVTEFAEALRLEPSHQGARRNLKKARALLKAESR